MVTFFLFFFFLSIVFTLVISAISHLKRTKLAFEKKYILPPKIHGY